ncbi:uncharacterized protein LOC143228923 isoform X2 [Tachypleus tridentatus]
MNRQDGFKHQCCWCAKIFKNKRNAERHQLYHCHERPPSYPSERFMCSLCEKTYCRQEYLDQHSCWVKKEMAKKKEMDKDSMPYMWEEIYYDRKHASPQKDSSGTNFHFQIVNWERMTFIILGICFIRLAPILHLESTFLSAAPLDGALCVGNRKSRGGAESSVESVVLHFVWTIRKTVSLTFI